MFLEIWKFLVLEDSDMAWKPMIGNFSIILCCFFDGKWLRGRIWARVQLGFEESSEIIATGRMHWWITRHAHLKKTTHNKAPKSEKFQDIHKSQIDCEIEEKQQSVRKKKNMGRLPLLLSVRRWRENTQIVIRFWRRSKEIRLDDGDG